MTWIDDRIAERENEKSRKSLILEQAEKIFTALWSDLRSFVDEANKKGFSLSMNGSTFEREITRAVIPVPAGQRYSPEILQVRLSREQGIVSAQGPGVNIEFVLAVCSDGVVCLKRGGKEVLSRDAAIAILDPFLFPSIAARI